MKARDGNRDLGTGRICTGVEFSARRQQKIRGNRPFHSALRIGSYLCTVSVAAQRGGCTDIKALCLACIAIEDRSKLFACDRVFGAEFSIGIAADDSLRRRPFNGLGIPSAARNIGEFSDIRDGRLTFDAVQDRDQHCARQCTLFAQAVQIFDYAIHAGWDKEYGGLLYFIDCLGCPPEAYEHDMKLWWPHNEILIASLMIYQKTGKQEYWDWFCKTADYCREHFCEPEFGEWYGYLRRDGLPTQPPCKGSTFKGPFHVPRSLMIADRLLTQLEQRQ